MSSPLLASRRLPQTRLSLPRWASVLPTHWSLPKLPELVCFLLLLGAWWRWTNMQRQLKANRDTLVMYIFSNTDAEYINNLRYFVSEAIHPDDRCHYIIVVQQPTAEGVPHHEALTDELHLPHTAAEAAEHAAAGMPPLPKLPHNAEYVYHHNECYDWGSYGWLLVLSGKVDATLYQFFVLLNSSVRGPYLPPYLRGVMHWTDPLISKLSDDVKVVGATISCEGSPYKVCLGMQVQGNPADVWRQNPHVQSYVLATDRVGISLMLRDERVFACHNDRFDAIFFSEMGSAWVVLHAGFNIASLMFRYQGVDWRNRSNWGCNGNKSPVGRLYNDGIDIDPYEVMFVKTKSIHMRDPPMSVAKALKYQEWQAPFPRHARTAAEAARVSGNAQELPISRERARRILAALERGPGCFDFDFYASSNPELELLQPSDLSPEAYTHILARLSQPGPFDLSDLEMLETHRHGEEANKLAASGNEVSSGNGDAVVYEGIGEVSSSGEGTLYGVTDAVLEGVAANGEGRHSGADGATRSEAGEEGATRAADVLGAAREAHRKLMWRHWVLAGQFDERWQGRFTCPLVYPHYPAFLLVST